MPQYDMNNRPRPYSQTPEDMDAAVEIPILELIPSEPCVVQEKYEPLFESISQDGLNTPIAIFQLGESTMVIHGHHRAKVMYELGHQTVPCKPIPVNKDQYGYLEWLLQKRLDTQMTFANISTLQYMQDRESLVKEENQEFFEANPLES